MATQGMATQGMASQGMASQGMASQGTASLSIGQVAAAAGINTSQIRYYERIGVLPPPERVGGQRRYDEQVLHRLAIIDVAQRAGFTLGEIRDLTTARVRELAERKLPDLDALIRRAEAVRKWLVLAQSCDCETVDVCSLFTDPELAPPPLAAR
jgi:MerR family transcriptional regulator, redox-sensitive transcriptional activator SoxR